MMRFPKRKAWRSREHLDWVKSLPCCICGRPADESHHIIGVGHYGGMGTKASDALTAPVCREHHDEIHRDANLWPDQFQWVMETLALWREEQDG